MAANAALLNRGMAYLHFRNLISHVFMAAKAERVAGCFKVELIPGGMRIVAVYTPPLYYNLVNTQGTGRNYILMACKTNLVRIRP